MAQLKLDQISSEKELQLKDHQIEELRRENETLKQIETNDADVDFSLDFKQLQNINSNYERFLEIADD